jgi:hypothetical protein
MTSLVVGYITILAPLLIVVVGCAVAGYLMLSPVDRGFVGVLLGFFLGPIGVLIAWPMRANALYAREQRERRGEPDVDAPRVPAPRVPAPVRSLTHELDELIAQRARGEISAAEYERRKTELIG